MVEPKPKPKPPTKRSASVPPARRVTLAPSTFDDGVLVVDRPRRVHRFLLSDGRTVDVLTDRDDSDVRVAVLEWAGVASIEGVVVLEDDPPRQPGDFRGL